MRAFWTQLRQPGNVSKPEPSQIQHNPAKPSKQPTNTNTQTAACTYPSDLKALNKLPSARLQAGELCKGLATSMAYMRPLVGFKAQGATRKQHDQWHTEQQQSHARRSNLISTLKGVNYRSSLLLLPTARIAHLSLAMSGPATAAAAASAAAATAATAAAAWSASTLSLAIIAHAGHKEHCDGNDPPVLPQEGLLLWLLLRSGLQRPPASFFCGKYQSKKGASCKLGDIRQLEPLHVSQGWD